MLIIQNEGNPAAIRHAIIDSIGPSLNQFRICSAYMTLGGSKMFMDCCLRFLSEHDFLKIPKTVVTSLDYGLTEPSALRFWQQLQNSEVRVAGAEMLANGSSLKPRFAYHPKMYAFNFSDKAPSIITGSANLTGRGLTMNTEAVWLAQGIDANGLDREWSNAIAGTVVPDNNLIDAYELARKKTRRLEPFQDTEPVPPPEIQPGAGGALPIFSDQASKGIVAPEQFREMWVQVEKLQGGSRNQLELPRGSHRFFGFKFSNYSSGNVERIGVPIFVSGARSWNDRPLTWHGDNMMERINLPTIAQGGFDYTNSVILFRRLDSGAFEIAATLWNSDLSNAWITASVRSGHIFRLGKKTHRVCGFI